MTDSSCATSDQIAINYNILIGIDCAPVAHIANEIVVHYNSAAPHQFWQRSNKPHAMTYDAFEDLFIGKGTLHKSSGWWQLVDIFGVSQTIRHNGGRHDDGGEAGERCI